MSTNIGHNIRRLRRQCGYSQARLAALTGRSQSWICKLETERANPTLASVVRVAEALDVAVAELLREPVERAA
jgi:transcriptional regulator with XRE-family HTH domain